MARNARLADLACTRRFAAAALCRIAAAWMKRTPGRRTDDRRHLAAQRQLAARGDRVRHRHGVEQRACIRVTGMTENPAAVGHLNEPAEVKHHHPVADGSNNSQVVRDEYDGKARGALFTLQHAEYLLPHRAVERRDCLVTDEHAGVNDERPGNRDALRLAA